MALHLGWSLEIENGGGHFISNANHINVGISKTITFITYLSVTSG